MRILIIGSPRSGKTTLSAAMGVILNVTPRATDEFKELDWSLASEKAADWFDAKGPWVIEGTMAVRALRKWLARNATGMPADLVLYRYRAFKQVTPGQASMAKAVATIWSGIAADVQGRGSLVYHV